MKIIFKTFLTTLILIFTSLPVFAGDIAYDIDFNELEQGEYSVNNFGIFNINGIGWNAVNEGNIAIGVENENGFIDKGEQKYIVVPDADKYIEVSCKIRLDNIDEIMHILNFRGGSVDDNINYGYALYVNNAWDGGISVSASSDATLQNPDIATIRANWSTSILYNDNYVYIYKNEWFNVKMSYDFTTKLYKIYFSDNGTDYYQIYEQNIPNVVGGKETCIRTIWLDGNACYDDISIKVSNSENTEYLWNYDKYRCFDDCETGDMTGDSLVSYSGSTCIQDSDGNIYRAGTINNNLINVNKPAQRFLIIGADVRRKDNVSVEQIRLGAFKSDDTYVDLRQDYNNIISDNDDTRWHSIVYILDILNNSRTIFVDGTKIQTAAVNIPSGFSWENVSNTAFNMVGLDIDNIDVAIDCDIGYFGGWFENSTNTKINAQFTGESEIKYKKLLFNYQEKTDKVNVIMALYKKDGESSRLIKLTSQSIKCWGTGTLVSGNIPLDNIEFDNEAQYYIKTFIIDDLQQLQPLDNTRNLKN